MAEKIPVFIRYLQEVCGAIYNDSRLIEGKYRWCRRGTPFSGASYNETFRMLKRRGVISEQHISPNLGLRLGYPTRWFSTGLVSAPRYGAHICIVKDSVRLLELSHDPEAARVFINNFRFKEAVKVLKEVIGHDPHPQRKCRSVSVVLGRVARGKSPQAARQSGRNESAAHS